MQTILTPPSHNITSSNLLSSLISKQLKKRRVFVSYHHALDQHYCDLLSAYFSQELQLYTDRRLDEPVRSNDPEYINRVIREDHIQGSSITIVLCGQDTHKRKYVDWEIRSTLHHKHALLGLILPSCKRDLNNNLIVPTRLYNNCISGYAHWVHWDNRWIEQPHQFFLEMETAIQKSINKSFIQNSSEKMARNSS